MSCSNCYNGCPQIISDQCVKYTGIDIPVLGIKNGDSLSYVEQAIITFLTSTLDGTGIKPNIDQSIICNIVKKYLPTCGDLTVVDFIKALIKAVCELKPLVDENTTDITTINNFIDELEAAYDVDCLNDIDENAVTPTSGTHDVLQAVIDRLCAFITDVNVTYVKIEYLPDLIQDYLETLPSATKYYTRMVPYMAVPFFPTPAVTGKFNNGVGQDEWEKIYYCNGQSVAGYQTPDLRGRVPVGVTDGTMAGGALPAQTLPGGLNPTYAMLTVTGSNGVNLLEGQLPSHTHIPTIVLNDPGHTHDILGIRGGDNDDMSNTERFAGGDKTNNESSFYFTNTTACQSKNTGITVSSQTNSFTGSNEAHPNIQPSIGCYYIMYIP